VYLVLKCDIFKAFNGGGASGTAGGAPVVVAVVVVVATGVVAAGAATGVAAAGGIAGSEDFFSSPVVSCLWVAVIPELSLPGPASSTLTFAGLPGTAAGPPTGAAAEAGGTEVLFTSPTPVPTGVAATVTTDVVVVSCSTLIRFTVGSSAGTETGAGLLSTAVSSTDSCFAITEITESDFPLLLI